MLWIFGLFLVTPCALTSCHIVISKQGSSIRALGYNRCVIGRRPHDQNHTVRFRQRQRTAVEHETHSWSEVISDKLERGCKRWHPLTSGRRYGKKSSLWVYMFLHPSLTHHRNINPFENKVWEIYFYEEMLFICSLKSFTVFDHVSPCMCITAIQHPSPSSLTAMDKEEK